MKKSLMLICFAAMLMPPAVFGDVVYQITIDTSPLAGVDGFMAFDLLGGTPVQNNVATISNFATMGTLGTASSSGDVTGSFTSQPVVLTASGFFNEYLQEMVFGGGNTTFQLDLTTNFLSGSSPDAFSFFLLDSSLSPFATSDPSGADSLITINITDNPTPDVFTSQSATATVAVAGAVPEPGSVALLATAVAALVLWRGLRRAG